MRERVLVVPPMFVSPRAVELVPLFRIGLEGLRSEFDVDIYRWPLRKGSEVEPSWRAVVDDLREQLTPGCHLLSLGLQAPTCLMALDRDRVGVRSFTCDGLFPTPATLRALGLTSLAEGAAAALRFYRGSPQEVARMSLPGTSDEEAGALAQAFNEDVEWPKLVEASESYTHLNLVAEAPLVRTPTLCLPFEIPLSGVEEGSAILLRFAPDAEIRPSLGFPSRDSVVAFTNEVIPFIKAHSAGRSASRESRDNSCRDRPP